MNPLMVYWNQPNQSKLVFFKMSTSLCRNTDAEGCMYSHTRVYDDTYSPAQYAERAWEQ